MSKKSTKHKSSIMASLGFVCFTGLVLSLHFDECLWLFHVFVCLYLSNVVWYCFKSFPLYGTKNCIY